jgi:hypothetical protein
MSTPISIFAAMRRAVMDATLQDGDTLQRQLEEKPKKVILSPKKEVPLPRHRHRYGKWEEDNDK